jgi:hypothetical protein
VNAPAPAGGDPTLLLHVDVDELAWTFALVADHHPRRTVEVAQAGAPRRRSTRCTVAGASPERPGDPVRSFQGDPSPGEDGHLAGVAEPHWRAVRSAGTIGEPGGPLGPEPPDPLVAGRRRTPLRLRGHRNAPAHLEHPGHKQQPSLWRELRPSMSHESLPPVWLDPDEQGGSHLLNNVLMNYN